MRVVYKIVLGLLLFNAFMTFYSPLFNACVETPIDKGAIGYDDEQLTKYEPKTGISGMMELIFGDPDDGDLTSEVAWGAFGIISVVALSAALFMKNYIVIGVGLFVGIVVSLYIKMSAFIALIGVQADMGNTTGNLLITSVIAIVGIAIGLIVVFSVVDMFAPAAARE